ncbi:MAG: DUF1624 domain-containing protein [Deltaproteobacteria bacterium]|nr:MAG: DUF1624 domain-containing protein [Deltaproteobacteria bacterium]
MRIGASATRGSMLPAPTRIRAIDWLRGLAVLLMIQTHALALLRPELRSGALFDSLQWVDGLVAPSFILAAGFSMALTQVRAASAPGAAEARRRRMLRTLRRLGEVLLVGILVNWMWFPIFREPRWIVRMDILPCVGLSLLLALPMLFALAPYPRALRWASLLLAAAVFGVSPLAEPLGPPWNRFLNHHSDAVFPLLPWAGYVYLGAAIGSATAEEGRRGAAVWLGALAAAGIVVWSLTPWFAALYPPHDGSAAVRFVEVFGTSSLAGYFFHEMLLFFRVFGFSFEARWGKSCSWPQYAALTILLAACTFVLTWMTARIYAAVEQRATAAAA